VSRIESISVVGTGRARTAPDLVTLDLGVEAHDATVDAAVAGSNQSMTAVQAALLDAGVAEADLRTSNLSIRTEYDRQGRSVSGYVVNHGLTVRLRDLAGAGAVIATAVAAGGDRCRVNNLQMSVGDDAALVARLERRPFARACPAPERRRRPGSRPGGGAHDGGRVGGQRPAPGGLARGQRLGDGRVGARVTPSPAV
jgi:uncharacterized protein YggE